MILPLFTFTQEVKDQMVIQLVVLNQEDLTVVDKVITTQLPIYQAVEEEHPI
jgi:hypothetical protein